MIIINFYTLYTSMDVYTHLLDKKINKATIVLNDTINQVALNRYLQDVPSQSRKIHILFKCTWNMFQKGANSRPQITSLRGYKLRQNFFSDHNSMKLEINYRKKTEKITNTWRLNNMLPNNKGSMNKSNRKSENTLS